MRDYSPTQLEPLISRSILATRHTRGFPNLPTHSYFHTPSSISTTKPTQKRATTPVAITIKSSVVLDGVVGCKSVDHTIGTHIFIAIIHLYSNTVQPYNAIYQDTDCIFYTSSLTLSAKPPSPLHLHQCKLQKCSPRATNITLMSGICQQFAYAKYSSNQSVSQNDSCFSEGRRANLRFPLTHKNDSMCDRS